MRSVLLATLALFVLSIPAQAYTVVRKDGTKFEAAGPPEYKDGQAFFSLPGGSRGSMPESAINKDATERANQGEASEASDSGVVTNEALAGGEEKSSGFTNEDLEKMKAEEESPSSGAVTNEALEQTESPSGAVTNEDLEGVEGNLTTSEAPSAEEPAEEPAAEEEPTAEEAPAEEEPAAE